MDAQHNASIALLLNMQQSSPRPGSRWLLVCCSTAGSWFKFDAAMSLAAEHDLTVLLHVMVIHVNTSVHSEEVIASAADLTRKSKFKLRLGQYEM